MNLEHAWIADGQAARFIKEMEVLPDPVAYLSVREAYAALVGILKPDVRYSIEWETQPDGQIFHRFNRKLPLEAWLIARPVDEDGKRIRGEDIAVIPIALSDAVIWGMRDTIERVLRDELDELKAGV